jgi:hypothetical protein
VSRRTPTPAEVALSRAREQYRQLEAAAGDLGAAHEVHAHQPQVAHPGPGRRCPDHPSRLATDCPLCGLNPIRALRKDMFDHAAQPPIRRPV